MYTINLDTVDDRYTGEPTLVERVILYMDNKIVDIAEFENAGGTYDWTRAEIIDQMKKRNGIAV